MYYTEYGQAAINHYRSVQHMFNMCISHSETDLINTDHDILYRIYYLCGHIIECVAIYWIYKQFRWEVNPADDHWKGLKTSIKRHTNPHFTDKSRLDYNKVSVKDRFLVFKRGEKIYPSEYKTKRNENDFMHISGHEFQKYIEQIIVPGNFVQVPFFRQTDEDDVNYAKGIELLHWWKPDIRYYYDGRVNHFNYKKFKESGGSGVNVDIESIQQLLDICRLATETIIHTPRAKRLLPPAD